MKRFSWVLRWIASRRVRAFPRFGASASSLPRVVTVLLVPTLAVAVTSFALTFTARRTPPEPVQVVNLGNPAARTQAADIAPIAILFGGRPGADGSNIKLLGVIAQGARGQGIALVTVDDRPAQATRAGEEIAAGVTLAEVRADRVLVSRSGTTQEIRLPAKPAPEGIVRVP